MRQPGVGAVIRYGYLWAADAHRGMREGLKNRPCVVVVTLTDGNGKDVLIVMPITHVQPAATDLAVELPIATKRRLGLDEDRSWIVTREYNSFVWPGYDIRPDESGEIIIGTLPGTLVARAITNLRINAMAGRVTRAERQ